MSRHGYRQLQIRSVNLEPTRGAETQKKGPCVIIQSDLVNRESQTVIVAPILPGRKDWPFAVNITPTQQNGLDKPRHINIKQMRAVDISRIENRQAMLEQEYLQAIHTAIEIVFGL